MHPIFLILVHLFSELNQVPSKYNLHGFEQTHTAYMQYLSPGFLMDFDDIYKIQTKTSLAKATLNPPYSPRVASSELMDGTLSLESLRLPGGLEFQEAVFYPGYLMSTANQGFLVLQKQGCQQDPKRVLLSSVTYAALLG